jgi:hypothetical protein
VVVGNAQDKRGEKDKEGLSTRIIMSMAAEVGDLVRATERIRVQFLALAKENNLNVMLD